MQRRQLSQTPTRIPTGRIVSAKSASKGSRSAGIESSASAGANANVVCPATVDQCPVKCAVCEQNVDDGKHQALFCEGVCKCWHHRYCAGVTVGHFDALSSSSDPFYCIGCFQKSCNEEMAKLKDTISTLREEVIQLREVLEEKCKNGTAIPHHSTSDESWKLSHGGVRGGRGRGRGHRGGSRRGRVGNNGGEAEEERTRRRGRGGVGGICGDDCDGSSGGGRGGAGGGAGGTVGVGGGAGGAGGGGNSSVNTRRQKTTEKTRVEGARRVWGTMKVTTTASLNFSISKFCPVNHFTNVLTENCEG